MASGDRDRAHPDHARLFLRVPALPPMVLGVPLAVGLVIELTVGTSFLPRSVALGAGIPLVCAGVALWAWAIATFLAHGEHPDPLHPTHAIIEAGPYRFSRNPQYLAFVVSAVGLAFLMDSIAVLAAVPFSIVAVQWLIIRPEEEYLQRKFGETYASYRNRVRRWI